MKNYCESDYKSFKEKQSCKTQLQMKATPDAQKKALLHAIDTLSEQEDYANIEALRILTEKLTGEFSIHEDNIETLICCILLSVSSLVKDESVERLVEIRRFVEDIRYSM